MARELSLQRGVETPNPSNFEYGRIVNGQTYLDEGIWADIVYNFHKICERAGSLNGLPENLANGYQFIDGLNDFIRARTMQQRGNVTTPDFILTDITTYDNLVDFDAAAGDKLDLSSIISNAGANWVLLQIISTTSNANANGEGGELHIYKNNMSSTTNINVSKHYNIAQNNTGLYKIKKIEELWVEINPGDRKIYAKAYTPLNGFDSVSIIVKSWTRYY